MSGEKRQDDSNGGKIRILKAALLAHCKVLTRYLSTNNGQSKLSVQPAASTLFLQNVQEWKWYSKSEYAYFPKIFLTILCTKAVCKVHGLILLLRVGNLWRCGDGIFFEVPRLVSGSLLTTLHPLVENVPQTVDHFKISCLGAPFSWM
jgi:hypothetical protein